MMQWDGTVLCVPDMIWDLTFTGASSLRGPYDAYSQNTFGFIAVANESILAALNVRLTVRGLHRTLHSEGTMVRAQYRRRGVARALWEKAIAELKPTKVSLHIVSCRGRYLIESLQRAHPGILWDVSFSSPRIRTHKRKAS